jgi:pyridoxamine 5'-phosphate oxidase
LTKSYHQIREEYLRDKLDESSVHPNPILQFDKWIREAIEAGVPHPTSMILATCGNNAQPSARVVLLKHADENGFQFFSNFDSKKGKQLLQNPKAALTFFWMQLERQVRIEGTAEKVPEEISDRYFNSRPLESRLSAVVSPQSQIIESREDLELQKEQLRQKYPDGAISRPENWGGYLLRPGYFEFWQGRESRLHDRIVYQSAKNKWEMKRLAP